MRLRHIEVFHALMKSATMTEAARRLHVSQPAVSMVLKHTELSLRMKLFERAGGRLAPTPEALALLPEVEQIFRRIEALDRSVQELRSAAAGTISVAASATVASFVLPALLMSFASKRPKARIVLRVLPTSQVQASVRDRRVDLGIIYVPSLPVDDDLAQTVAHTSSVVCVMPREHRLAAKPTIRPADLAGEPLVTFGIASELGAQIAAAFASENAKRNLRIESSSSFASISLAAAGLGVALVESLGMIKASPDLTEREFLPRIETRIVLLHGSDRPKSRLAAAFSKHVVDSLSAGQP